jgi:hypothetical protein
MVLTDDPRAPLKEMGELGLMSVVLPDTLGSPRQDAVTTGGVSKEIVCSDFDRARGLRPADLAAPGRVTFPRVEGEPQIAAIRQRIIARKQAGRAAVRDL